MAESEQEEERSIVAGREHEDYTDFCRRSLHYSSGHFTAVMNEDEEEMAKAQWERGCRYLTQKDCVVKKLRACVLLSDRGRNGARSEDLTAYKTFISSLRTGLKRNKSICHLHLDCPDEENPLLLGLDCLSQLFMDLRDNTSMRRLSFEHPLQDRSVHALASLLESTQTLTDLSIILDNEDQVVPFSQGLKSNSSLKDLNIRLTWGIISQDLTHISSVLEESSTIEAITVCLEDLNSALDVTSLLRGLITSKSVQTFDISGEGLMTYSPEIIRDVLKLNDILKVLLLKIHSQTELAAFAEGLRSNGALEQLAVDFRPTLGTSFVHLLRVVLEALCNGKSMVKHLTVRADPRSLNQPDSSEDIASVSDLLRQCTALESLEVALDMESWAADLLDAFTPALCEESCSVRSLRLFGRLGQNDCTKIARILSKKPRALTSLSLVYGGIDQNGFDTIMRAERSNPCLERLCLCWLLVSSTVEVLKTLKDNECLKKLDLSNNSRVIGNVGAGALAEVLTSDNTCLETLYLNDCGIKDAGVTAIGEMLPYNTSLKHVQLHWNEFGKSAAVALVRGLEKNMSVEELTGIPDKFYDEQEQAAYYTALNKADRKSYLEEDKMTDDDWLKAVGRFDDCGGLSAIYFAVRSKPHFVFRRPDEKMMSTGKRKRDEDY